ncbi:rhodanese-like domain-containing protein [Desulfoluna spongiiphila]|uniref:rhodanese-like domain-containing protein n=1 Tax=Desulfoluna spongiiphila TaxID=419481 RepID=UPI00125AC83A|nr:rhodanese-like domain-containing protein [Desulfoluna spongiiphila]VVS91398.1 rhodanese-like domain [Desulfoluna spongiiphila]
MDNLKDYFREMDFEAFGTGGFATAPTALPGLIKNRAFLLDLRTREEADGFSLPVAMHIPLHELPDRLDEIPGDIPVVLFAGEPWRPSVAMAYLIAKGFDQVSMIPQGLPEMAKMLKPGPLHAAGVHQTTETRPQCGCRPCC